MRKHALAQQTKTGCDIDTAALRVFSNAEGAYGANVGMLIDAGVWSDEDEISQTFARRKCFAYGRKGDCVAASRPAGERSRERRFCLSELWTASNSASRASTITSTGPGGMGRAAARARGRVAPIYISDQTRGAGKVRSRASRSRSRPERVSSIRNGTRAC